MPSDDWYRRRTWSEQDRRDFHARLNRSRGDFHKAQYTRIQALELHEAGGAAAAADSLELLDLVLDRWPDDSQLAMINLQRAQCLTDLGRELEAVEAYRAAFEAQRNRPGLMTAAHELFAYWVATGDRRELFDEALSALDEFTPPSGYAFPISQYRSEGSRALILAARRDRESAVPHAHLALEAAAAIHSGFWKHPGLGLVGSGDDPIRAKLVRLAG